MYVQMLKESECEQIGRMEVSHGCEGQLAGEVFSGSCEENAWEAEKCDRENLSVTRAVAQCCFMIQKPPPCHPDNLEHKIL